MPRHLPPLNALKAFEAAARHESFTRAAEELCVTQGAVSHNAVGATNEDASRGTLLNQASMALDAAADGQGIALARCALAIWDVMPGDWFAHLGWRCRCRTPIGLSVRR